MNLSLHEVTSVNLKSPHKLGGEGTRMRWTQTIIVRTARGDELELDMYADDPTPLAIHITSGYQTSRLFEQVKDIVKADLEARGVKNA